MRCHIERVMPREKLLYAGGKALSDAELLTVLIGTGNRHCSAEQIALALLTHFGNIRRVLAASCAQLCQVKGIGVSTYATLAACKELVYRSFHQKLLTSDTFNHAQDVEHFLLLALRDQAREVFAVMMLNSQHQLIALRDLFHGTINAASVYPREVVKQVLTDNAAAVILVHNHPSGCTSPSEADKRITANLVNALRLIDVPVLDHFIVAGSETVSFAQLGLL